MVPRRCSRHGRGWGGWRDRWWRGRGAGVLRGLRCGPWPRAAWGWRRPKWASCPASRRPDAPPCWSTGGIPADCHLQYLRGARAPSPRLGLVVSAAGLDYLGRGLCSLRCRPHHRFFSHFAAGAHVRVPTDLDSQALTTFRFWVRCSRLSLRSRCSALRRYARRTLPGSHRSGVFAVPSPRRSGSCRPGLLAPSGPALDPALVCPVRA